MAVLEATVTSKTRENMKKQAKTDKNQVKKVLLVAQELKLARVLAGNDKTARDRALKGLKKWFENRASTLPFTEDDFLRLWKGLFYSMWMSDKPLVQEECAESISKLLHALPFEASLLFYKCGMTILMNEWNGIDQLRLDKFLMFVRRLLRQALFVLKNELWRKKEVAQFAQCLSDTILESHTHRPKGLLLHFIEIFLEELAKVSEGKIYAHTTTDLLLPFIKHLASSDDPRIIDHIRKHMFVYLIRQSDLGLDYADKYKAWSSLGFPGSIDSMQKVEEADEDGSEEEAKAQNGSEEKEKVYDPRAGRVDVELPQIKFHARAIAKALQDCKFEKDSNSKSRKCIGELIEHFKKLHSGIYPLGIKKVKVAAHDVDTNLRRAVNRLVKFEQKIQGPPKNTKRKNEANHEIELRGGKKIKLDEGLTQKIREEFDRVAPKRKNLEPADSPPRKVQKRELPRKIQRKDIPKLQIESIFRRNSGMWLVSKVNADASSDSEGELFPENQWEASAGSMELPPLEKENARPSSLPASLLKNPFATPSPIKKVKINTKLNQSQDVQEHVKQIFSSPDIPYDPEKKPAKPLLKTPVKMSPINPFFVKSM